MQNCDFHQHMATSQKLPKIVSYRGKQAHMIDINIAVIPMTTSKLQGSLIY